MQFSSSESDNLESAHVDKTNGNVLEQVAGQNADKVSPVQASGAEPRQGEVQIAYENMDKEQKMVVDELTAKGWKVKIFKEPSGTFRLNMKGKDTDSSQDASLSFPINAEDWKVIEDEMISAMNKDEELDQEDKTVEELKFIEEWKKRSRE